MAEIEQNQSQMSEENDESVSTGWSARWDSQALGEVRAKAKAQKPPASPEQDAAN